jgi:hypothetical protein
MTTPLTLADVERLEQDIQLAKERERAGIVGTVIVSLETLEPLLATAREHLERLARADYPRKAIDVRVTANGFTWDQVIDALEERVSRLREHHEHGAGASACGYASSHTADVHLRDVTPEQFADESIAWLEKQQKRSKP